MFLTVRKADGTTRDLEIRLFVAEPADDPAHSVSRMFDVKGGETTDPIDAVEVEIEGKLRRLTEGDRLMLSVDLNEAELQPNTSIFAPVMCEKCGNDDQGTIFTKPDHEESAHGEPKVRLTYLAGFRCGKCGYVTKIKTDK